MFQKNHPFKCLGKKGGRRCGFSGGDFLLHLKILKDSQHLKILKQFMFQMLLPRTELIKLSSYLGYTYMFV